MKKIILSALVITIFFCWGCTKQVTSFYPQPAPFAYPTTYTFSNVNYTGQQSVLAKIDSLMMAIHHGDTTNNIVDTVVLKALFNNSNGSGLSLTNQCILAAQADILRYFDSIEVSSKSTVAASNGVAGVGTSSANHAVTYLESDSGFVYSELIKTAIMEGLIAYQIENIHLYDSINTSIDTATMKRNWDAAFGYFGVPVNFPADTTGLKYWGSYSNILDAALNSNSTIMTNFLIGRAAINNNYITGSTVLVGKGNGAITDADNIIVALDKLIAVAAIHELNQAQINFSLDPVVARDDLSISWGFVNSLNYNISPEKTYSNTQISTALQLYGTNLYNLTSARVDSIKTTISSIYGFTTTSF